MEDLLDAFEGCLGGAKKVQVDNFVNFFFFVDHCL